MPVCSYCGKSQGEVSAASEPGPRVYVCDACMAQANKVVEEELGKQAPQA